MFKPLITLSRALTEPQLFGKVFASPSFWTWRVVGKLIDGLPLTEPREIELFEQCTGRSYSRRAGWAVRQLILLAGRRAGKDRFPLCGRSVARGVVRRLASIHQRRRAGRGDFAGCRQTPSRNSSTLLPKVCWLRRCLPPKSPGRPMT